MSYYAKGDGYIHIKPIGDVEGFEKKAEKLVDLEWRDYWNEDPIETDNDILNVVRSLFIVSAAQIDYTHDHVCISGFYNYGQWYDDDFKASLKKLEPFCVEGEFDFVGEDDCQWRYIFRDGCWEEEYGETVYGEGVSSKNPTLSALLPIIGQSERLVIVQDGEAIAEFDDIKGVDEDYHNMTVKEIYTSVDGILGIPLLCIEVD